MKYESTLFIGSLTPVWSSDT